MNTTRGKAPEPDSLFLWIVSLTLKNIADQPNGKDFSEAFVYLLEQKIDLIGKDPARWDLTDVQMEALRKMGEAISIRFENPNFPWPYPTLH